ncbi:radical SAM protein [Candidatus Woesearchaeota archaeon]|nr:radical SAM protein [Candidatus Woesearchaeota archaeon]
MLKFSDLSFIEKDGKVIVKLYRYFSKEFEKGMLIEEFGDLQIVDDRIELSKFPGERGEKRFMRFFRKYKRDLTYALNGNRAIFVDEDMELPLVGLNFMGVVDKGSEMLEVKPITNCNADCVFCSVDEGPSSRKKIDFVVDVDYLADEVSKLLHFKASDGMSMWINPHGEPTLYARLVELVDKLLRISYVKDVTIISNGLLMTKDTVDRLAELIPKHGKRVKLSVSVSAVSEELSKKVMGKAYNAKLVQKNLEYVVDRLDLSITPVFLSWMNAEEMVKIIELAQRLNRNKDREEIRVAIQKFCHNKKGRNPGKEQSWESFFKDLKALEIKTNYKLTEELGKIKETPELPALCSKKEQIRVRVICEGRYPKDRLGVFETPQGRRAVTLLGCNPLKGIVKANVIQSKHNLIVAKC